MRKPSAALVLLVISLLFLSTMIMLLLTQRATPRHELKTIPFDFYTAQRNAFNLDPDKMHLGGISRGGSAQREFAIFNNHSYPQFGEFKVASDISMGSWFNISPGPHFYIKPYEDKHFTLTIIPLTTIEEGLYEGEIQIYLTEDTTTN